MPSGDAPWPHDTPGARAFARAFTSHYDEVTAELQQHAAQHPVFAKLLGAFPPEVLREEDRASRERLRRAFAGDWAAYAAPMRQQGAMYAELGVRFSDWYDLASLWSRALMPVLVREHATDAALLADALESMHDFLGGCSTSGIRCTDRWSVTLAPGSRCAGDLDDLSPTDAPRPRFAAGAARGS